MNSKFALVPAPVDSSAGDWVVKLLTILIMLTIHLVTSRSWDATEEQRMPFITKDGKRTFDPREAVRSESREQLEKLAEKFNLSMHEYGIDEL